MLSLLFLSPRAAKLHCQLRWWPDLPPLDPTLPARTFRKSTIHTHTHTHTHTYTHTHTHTHTFIHSLFITEIYIAPLQGYYSEALPTLAQLNRRILRLEQNVSERILESNRCNKGSPFHT